jgi:hypothetical protein
VAEQEFLAKIQKVSFKLKRMLADSYLDIDALKAALS